MVTKTGPQCPFDESHKQYAQSEQAGLDTEAVAAGCAAWPPGSPQQHHCPRKGEVDEGEVSDGGQLDEV